LRYIARLARGLLESAYEECLCHELNLRGIQFRRQVPLPVTYKGVNLDCGYRINLIILEFKCVEHVLPVHEAQLLSYMKMANKRVGLLLNFHVAALVRGGIVRKVI
jgi:GxxExxY protein